MSSKEYTQETYYYNFQSKSILQLIEEFQNLPTEREKIEGLYLKIRDGWRYNAYAISLDPSHFRASYISKKQEAHCIDKSILLVAGLRGLSIPARLRLAKVSNHLASERLARELGTDVIAPHGFAEVYLKGKWVKCSPAFNRELCERYQVDALEFDGTADSIMQQYNRNNQKFMEYLEDYGSFADVPMEFILRTFKENYPGLYQRLRFSQNGNNDS